MKGLRVSGLGLRLTDEFQILKVLVGAMAVRARFFTKGTEVHRFGVP